jgi:hypothetical protein
MTAATALLQVLLVEDDLPDVAFMASSFAEHQAPTELHHVVDGADAWRACAAKVDTPTRPGRI